MNCRPRQWLNTWQTLASSHRLISLSTRRNLPFSLQVRPAIPKHLPVTSVCVSSLSSSGNYRREELQHHKGSQTVASALRHDAVKCLVNYHSINVTGFRCGITDSFSERRSGNRDFSSQRAFSTMPPIAEADPLRNQVTKWINEPSHPVVIFSKTTCPYCMKVKDVFRDLQVPVSVHELDVLENGPAIQDILLQLTGQKTVPNIFFHGQHVGGCDDTLRLLKSGQLKQMLDVQNNGQNSNTGRGPNADSTTTSNDTVHTPGNAPGSAFADHPPATGTYSSASVPQEGTQSTDNLRRQVEKWIKDDSVPVIVFSKTTCPFCTKVKALFEEQKILANVIELNTVPNGSQIQDALLAITGQKTVPSVFVKGQHIGGCDATMKLHSEGQLMPLIQGGSARPASKRQSSPSGKDEPRQPRGSELPWTPNASAPSEQQSKVPPMDGSKQANQIKFVPTDKYDYDLVVIGGGSGGLATSKEAAKLGAKVAVFDYVQPTPIGTKWGLGGTCVNVGCIPKKLMHQAALLRGYYDDAKKFGWQMSEENPQHDWNKMVEAIQDYIHGLNWKYKVALRDMNVTYLNSYAKFTDDHTLVATNAKGKESTVTAERFIIATGGRPRYPDIPGGKQFCITSDDIFSLAYPPGKTLVVGASYVALECGGFLKKLGFDVTVMVRSILLRGFDQDMAERIGAYMEKENGVKFIRGATPTKVEQIEEGLPGRLKVTWEMNGQESWDEYNTVLFAVGRNACTTNIGLEKIGVKINPKSGKLVTENEQTSVEHVYAIGDVLDGKPELTPVAIAAGILLARRLYGGSNDTYDYNMIPTTVFTPIEYGAIGYAEEMAMEKFGKENIETYHTLYRPLEWAVPGHAEDQCYGKLVCNKLDDDRVVGFHVLGPNAGEITQGYAVAMRMGAKKRDFDATTGIHPTASEIFTTLTTTKSSGAALGQAGC
ncbi:hypothetical protein RvY_16909-2 [Ramazzottius varieornatus]|uniref:thioredoxin-disulfide reductase (NADPH) n=1 Tax=Ramazzottius varieornatus TaxID=947166 RepID=A0A1D1W6E1_RAMVA|nr:hypothetical protein RvY_16909-2 [Ramazzottius varieornatus]